MSRPLLALLLCLTALPAAAQDTAPNTAPNTTQDVTPDTTADQPAAEAPEKPEQTPADADQDARIRNNPIVARLSAFARAFEAQDAEAIAGLYTDDAALLPPQGAPIVGRPAIAAQYAATFETGATNLRINIQEIRQHGPATAVEIATTQLDLPDATIHGRYMHVWALTESGWLLSRDIYQVLSADPRD